MGVSVILLCFFKRKVSIMKITKRISSFIAVLLFATTYSPLVKAIEKNDLDSIGVIAARKDFGISGKDTTVSVEDTFKAENEVSFKHGDEVSYFVKRVAPMAKVLHLSREQTPDGVKIINDSSGPSIEQLFSEGFYRYNFPQLKNNAVYTIAYGNDNHMPGTTPASRALAQKIKQINENSQGAVLFVGDMKLDNLQNLTVYSFSAGVLASNYVIAPTSTVATHVGGAEGSMEFKREVGTSIAAPTVAGCLALLQEAFPNATGKQLAILLLDTAEPITKISNEMVEKIRQSTNLSVRNIRSLPPQALFGRGIINVYKAIEKGKKILKSGASLPSQIQEIQLPISLIETARYDIFAHKIYQSLRTQYTDPTIKKRVIQYILSSLPTKELINFPLYEDNDGVTVRPHAKTALQWIYEGIKEHRLTNSSYQEKLSAIVVNYAFTLPQKDKEVILNNELSRYGKDMGIELKKILINALPQGKNIILDDVKRELKEFFEKNATYDSWGASFSDEDLLSNLNDLSEENLDKIFAEIVTDRNITPDSWLNFIRAINDNPVLQRKLSLIRIALGKIKVQDFDPSHFEEVKKNVNTEIQIFLKGLSIN